MIRKTEPSNMPLLKRENTFDMYLDEIEPFCHGHIPPKLTSSPKEFHDLGVSHGQVSFQDNEEIFGMANYVMKAYQNLEQAVGIILKKYPMNSRTSPLTGVSNC